MAIFNSLQSVEVFHLIFLSYLGRKLDKQKWTLKGGCNLRFFFRSPRYSDDMDLDVQAIPVDVLRIKVNSIISGMPFKTMLEVRGIAIDHVTEHKQTETTQRWKFGLMVPGLEQPVPTKIEFSRRGLEAGSVFEPVSPEIVRYYELPPIMANHYPAPIVWQQKIGAILSRTTSQARDVFDMYLILAAGRKPTAAGAAAGAPGFVWGSASAVLSRAFTSRVSAPGFARGSTSAAKARPLTVALTRDKKPGVAQVKENILAINFGQFKSQVVAYLEPDLQPQYDSEETWDAMRLRIIEALGDGPS